MTILHLIGDVLWISGLALAMSTVGFAREAGLGTLRQRIDVPLLLFSAGRAFATTSGLAMALWIPVALLLLAKLVAASFSRAERG